MNPDEFKKRTKTFALRTIRLVEALPNSQTSGVIGKQLLRAGTSVGANYRSACRAKSRADFISKMGHVEEEADETAYWMELLEESGLMSSERLASIKSEADGILAIAVASINTARSHNKSFRKNIRRHENSNNRESSGS